MAPNRAQPTTTVPTNPSGVPPQTSILESASSGFLGGSKEKGCFDRAAAAREIRGPRQLGPVQRAHPAWRQVVAQIHLTVAYTPQPTARGDRVSTALRTHEDREAPFGTLRGAAASDIHR